MTDQPNPPTKAIVWTVVGIALLVWGLWSGINGGGITAWILAIAGALNAAVFGSQLLGRRDE